MVVPLDLSSGLTSPVQPSAKFLSGTPERLGWRIMKRGWFRVEL